MDERQMPLDWLPTIPWRYATIVVDGFLVVAVIIVPTAVLPAHEVSRILLPDAGVRMSPTGSAVADELCLSMGETRRAT